MTKGTHDHLTFILVEPNQLEFKTVDHSFCPGILNKEMERIQFLLPILIM